MPNVLFVLSCLLVFAAVGGHAQDAAPDSSVRQPAVPVSVGPVTRGDIPLFVRAVGSVEASAVVEIKARISGVVQDVHFRAGQDVRVGDRLFSIDDRELTAALHVAGANLAQAKARLAKAEKDARRFAGLLRDGIVSRDQQEAVSTDEAALRAQVLAQEAAVEAARVALSHAEIRAPLAARAGDVLLHAGNMVKANADSPMVVLSRLEPVDVRFSVPEKYLSTIRERMLTSALRVEATPTGSPDAVRGVLHFVDNTVDTGTGTIVLKARFANTDRALWPGQFTDVILELGRKDNAVLVPEQAVMPGADGEFVYVVRADKTVDYRLVRTGVRHAGLAEVLSGLEGGEHVVLDGHLRLSPGAAVSLRPATRDAGQGAR